MATSKPASSNLGSTRAYNIGALTLANGMTAGKGVRDGISDNLPFDKRIYGGITGSDKKNGFPDLTLNKYRVGVIRNLPGIFPNKNQNYRMWFMFNPTEITAAFATNTDALPPAYTFTSLGAAGSGVAAVPNLVTSQTVSWSLFFDRTYEMRYGDSVYGKKEEPSENRGVLTDVAALYNILGTFETVGATPLSSPVEVVFGQTAGGQIWGFTGYVSSVNLTYGVFRHDMMPSRVEVDLQMILTYLGSASGTGGNGSGGKTTTGLSPAAQKSIGSLRYLTSTGPLGTGSGSGGYSTALKKATSATTAINKKAGAGLTKNPGVGL